MRVSEIGKKLTKKEIKTRESELRRAFPNTFVKKSPYHFSAIFKTGDKAVDESYQKNMGKYKYFPMSNFTAFYSSNIATIKKTIKTPYNKLEKAIIQYRMGYYSPKNQIISQIDTRGDEYLEFIKFGDKKEVSEVMEEREIQREKENENFKEEVKNKLISLGYNISKKNPQNPKYSWEDYMGTKIASSISEEQALWGDLKNDLEINENHISRFLGSIFKNTKNFPKDFVVYNPATDYDKESFDEEFAYKEYDAIINIQRESAPKQLSKILQNINFHKAIAISSKLPNDSHYMQIDFKTKSLEEVKNTLAKLESEKGIIINSGNSFHYYNPLELMNKGAWENFMEKLKEFDSIGEFWPRFQQKQGFSMLRITPSFEKPFYPENINL